MRTEFEIELFEASLRNYCSHGNPLRFHNFAFSMRELVLRLIDRRAPDREVVKAVWYECDSDTHPVTRRQKLKYCAQGFLSDAYVNDAVLEELDESIRAYLKEFNFFNKYTHITEKHFRACPKKFYEDLKYVISRSKEVIEQIDSLENMVIESVPETLQDNMFGSIINSFPEELSILAHNVVVDHVSPEEIEVESLSRESIVIGVAGTVYVTQEYGKGDDYASLSENYPFKVSVSLSPESPSEISIEADAFVIDTSSWFGEED
ncbi:MAG: hypothetical protein AAGI44_15900 [Pseudomonadota bacterium]